MSLSQSQDGTPPPGTLEDGVAEGSYRGPSLTLALAGSCVGTSVGVAMSIVWVVGRAKKCLDHASE